MVAVDPAWPAVGVSMLALGFSIFAWIKGASIDRRLAKIEVDRRSEELESKAAANLSLRLDREAVRGSSISVRPVLLLSNSGMASARESTLEFLPDETYTLMRPSDIAALLPIDVDPGQEHRLPAFVHSNTPVAVEVWIRWTDDRGPQEKTVTLSTI